MLRFTAFACSLAAALLPVAACSMSRGDAEGGTDGTDRGQAVAASGSGGARSWAARDFDAVALGAVGDVDVQVGGDWSVTATGSPATLDKLLVERDGHTLKLLKKRGVRWESGDKVRFAISMPAIKEANIGGAGRITVNRVPGGDFTGNIGGSGTLDIRQMAVGQAEFAIGGSGDVLAAGRARSVEVTIGGSGHVRAKPLSTETATVTIAGAGDVGVTASRHADITILGSGDVDVGGGATCSTTKMGGGKVTCG